MVKRRKKRKPLAMRMRSAGLALVAAWFVATIGGVLALRWVNPPTTAFIVADRLDALFSAEPGYQFQQRWVDWAQISPSVKLAVVAAEDQRFADHFGFDFVQIEQALQQRSQGVSQRGASTITQQTAKNLFLWSGQSWLRKGLEAYFTLLIESCWPKARILEVYLNIAEFGQGVFGIGAASNYFFARSSSRLDRPQSALLAAVLPNPTRFRVNAPTPYLRTRQAWILRQMNALGGEQRMSTLDDRW
jgi:monofunctional biosynthetic peptidoglycan transglycosylase